MTWTRIEKNNYTTREEYRSCFGSDLRIADNSEIKEIKVISSLEFIHSDYPSIVLLYRESTNQNNTLLELCIRHLYGVTLHETLDNNTAIFNDYNYNKRNEGKRYIDRLLVTFQEKGKEVSWYQFRDCKIRDHKNITFLNVECERDDSSLGWSDIFYIFEKIFGDFRKSDIFIEICHKFRITRLDNEIYQKLLSYTQDNQIEKAIDKAILINDVYYTPVWQLALKLHDEALKENSKITSTMVYDLYNIIPKESPHYIEAQKKMLTIIIPDELTTVTMLEEKFKRLLLSQADQEIIDLFYHQLSGGLGLQPDIKNIQLNVDTLCLIAEKLKTLQQRITLLEDERSKQEQASDKVYKPTEKITKSVEQVHFLEDKNKHSNVLSRGAMIQKRLAHFEKLFKPQTQSLKKEENTHIESVNKLV